MTVKPWNMSKAMLLGEGRVGKTALRDSMIAKSLNFDLMQRVLALGSKPWNRSNVMLVGEGKLGKTALRDSMMGKPFEDTESTAGLTELTCDKLRAAVAIGRRWTEHRKPEREFEAGLAQHVSNMESIELQEKKSYPQSNEYVRNESPEPEQINKDFPINARQTYDDGLGGLIPHWKLHFFVSSTFTDTERERNELFNILKELSVHGDKHGIVVSFSDLRWGIPGVASLEHRTRIRELERCIDQSNGLFFLSPLSEKYVNIC